jgi:hypothetical protein
MAVELKPVLVGGGLQSGYELAAEDAAVGADLGSQACSSGRRWIIM